MVNIVTSPVQESADDPRSANPVILDKQPLNGSLASGVQAHGGGISMGVVGLLIGAVATSPLIALVGLVGGIAAGTVFLDQRKTSTNPIVQNADKTPLKRHPAGNVPVARGPESAIGVANAPRVVTDTRHETDPRPVAGGIAFDASFNEFEAVTPKPTGKHSPLRRKNI
jgi:hypothetical protein